MIYNGLPLSHVKDKELRAVLATVDRNLAKLFLLFESIIETDNTGQGIVRVKAPLVPRELAADPTTRSTYGRFGELATFNRKLFQKQGLTASDSEWNRAGILKESGVDSVGTGSLSQVVNHSSGTITKANVLITPTSAWFDANQFWVSAVTPTTFTVNVDALPDVGPFDFSWTILT